MDLTLDDSVVSQHPSVQDTLDPLFGWTSLNRREKHVVPIR